EIPSLSSYTNSRISLQAKRLGRTFSRNSVHLCERKWMNWIFRTAWHGSQLKCTRTATSPSVNSRLGWMIPILRYSKDTTASRTKRLASSTEKGLYGGCSAEAHLSLCKVLTSTRLHI